MIDPVDRLRRTCVAGVLNRAINPLKRTRRWLYQQWFESGRTSGSAIGTAVHLANRLDFAAVETAKMVVECFEIQG